MAAYRRVVVGGQAISVCAAGGREVVAMHTKGAGRRAERNGL